MEKNKKYNVVLGLMIFFFVLFVGICIAWVVGVIGIKTTQVDACKENSVIQNTDSDAIDINDLFAFDIQGNEYGLILKIENGELKYHLNDYKTTEYSYSSINSNNANFKVLDINVKRIKTVTSGSDTALSFIIIKNDGTTYVLSAKGDGSDVLYNKFNWLKEYKIDDISNIETLSGPYARFEADVTLLGGTTKHIVKTSEVK